MKSISNAIIVAGLVLSPACAFAKDFLPLKVIEASKSEEARTGAVLLDVRTDEESRDKLARWTSIYVRTKIDVIVDGRVISRPRLLTALTGGVMQIPGLTSDEIATLIPKLLDGRSILAVEGRE